MSHASHVQQPLDLGVFRDFKTAIQSINRATAKLPVNEQRRLLLARADKALHCALYRPTIKDAFRCAGVWPVSRDVVLKHPAVGDIPESLILPRAGNTKKRSRVDMSGVVLTSTEFIDALRAAEAAQKAKEEKAQAKKTATNKNQ